MADELRAWARGRAPELIERAEAEAVAILRDALLRAAVAEQRAARPAPPEPAAAAEAPLTGELVWAYCVMPAGDELPTGMTGVDSASAVEAIERAGLVALVSRVPRAEFGEDPLRRNLNDIEWLERIARRHEEVLDAALASATVVPLRLCTLYNDVDSVSDMLERERTALVEALDALRGREEWGVKLLADPARLAEAARERHPDADTLGSAVEGDEGSAYMLRRRRERQLRELADRLAAEIVDDVRRALDHCALQVVTRPPQNRELSRHAGEMLLNASCLVERERVAELERIVDELRGAHARAGVALELTGPWPPYNFVPASTTTTLL